MKNLTRVILFTVVALALGLTSAVSAADRYAAVAFSPSTSRWGYGNGYFTRAEATACAVVECGQSDAVTSWCKNAWIALAISDRSPGGYTDGHGHPRPPARVAGRWPKAACAMLTRTSSLAYLPIG